MIMEEDGEGSPKTPFWVQSSGNRRREISSIFLNSGILIIILCLAAVFSILFIIPWFLNLTSQIFRPNLVKKSWDWINAVLIILALIFGFLSRNKNHDEEEEEEEDRTVLIAQKSQSHSSTTLFQWDEFSSNGSIRTQKLHDNWYECNTSSSSSSFGLKRNSSSYPDLRDTTSFIDHRRFLDDTHVENPRLLVDKKIDPVEGQSENIKKRSLLPSDSPEKKKMSKSERKRSGGNGTKEFINSFYHQSKKKKNQRAKSLDNFESLLPSNTIPPPPPPPPPPRTSVFQNILSTKKRKPKKTIISVPAPPPPPPPPPIKTERKPIIPVKAMTLNRGSKPHEDESIIPRPPPPPPPPFKMPSWKFVVQGDYVRVGSFNSSISESSDAEDRESPTTSEISNVVDESSGSMFCPSPDVNTKAEMFIARFRAGLHLQKINSLEQKQRLGMSNLGPQAQINGPE